MGIFEFLKAEFLANDFFSGTLLTGVALVSLTYLRGVPARVYSFLLDRLTVTINVPSTDVYTFKLLNVWLSQIEFDTIFKKFTAIYDRDLETYLLSPMQGTYFFKYKHKFLMLAYSEKTPTVSEGNTFLFREIRLMYLGRDAGIAQSFLQDAKEAYESLHQDCQQLHIYHISADSWWDKYKPLKARIENAIFLPGKALEDLIEDGKEFLRSEERYNDLGIDYGRGYLFYGVPGSGKSSVTQVLATALKKNLCIISLNSIQSDTRFLTLISELPLNSILVIEDVDCFVEGREVKGGQKLNFSTVLNVLSGPYHIHGLMVIMTTNHEENLDPALMRSGRIDVRLEFTNCEPQQIRGLWNKFQIGSSEDCTKFLAQIEPSKISPADIQGHFLAYKTVGCILDNAHLLGVEESKGL